MGRYSACIVGINVGTLMILKNLSKIMNDILIITSSKIDIRNKITLIDVVPHMFIKNREPECAYLVTDRYYNILTSFDTIEVDDLDNVVIDRDRVYVNGREILVRRGLIICGDEVTIVPSYADFEFLKDVCSGRSRSYMLDGSDIFKMLEFYILFRDVVDIKISKKVREIVSEIPYIESIDFSEYCSDKNVIRFDIFSDKPRVRSCSCRLFKVEYDRVVRDFELLLRSFLFLYSGFSRELKIDMLVSDRFCILHIGDLLSSLRYKYRDISFFRSCVDYDSCRVCSRVACFNGFSLCSDVYCSSFSCLPFAEEVFYSFLNDVYGIYVPCVFSIYSMYSGLPIYTSAYSYALSRAFLRLEKEFK
ncbi:MAG: hypothetical protein GXO10_01030 [Crenarchaeota archaeon]|nr:hypothetical protein [Thermoproteota archaeon]